MTTEEIRSKVLETICHTFSIADVSCTGVIGSITEDSLDIVELALALESTFSISLNAYEETLNEMTVNRLVDIIAEILKSQRARKA